MSSTIAWLTLLIASSGLLCAETIQIDCSDILNARPVSIARGEKIVPWSVGIDGAGKADGFATISAARVHGDPVEHALPDDGKFAANADHGFVQLPYGKVGSENPQARSMPGASSCELKLRAKRFTRLYLFFTSAEGPSQLSLILHYKDGSTETHAVEIPDYYRAPVASEKDLFALAFDLAKWNAAGKLAEADHHFIYGWKFSPDKARILKSITFNKNAPGYLVFWGATGETAPKL